LKSVKRITHLFPLQEAAERHLKMFHQKINFRGFATEGREKSRHAVRKGPENQSVPIANLGHSGWPGWGFRLVGPPVTRSTPASSPRDRTSPI